MSVIIKGKPLEGWKGIGGAIVAHYVRDGRSLCGNWGFLHSENTYDVGTGTPDLKLCCKVCFRKAARLARAAAVRA